VRWISFWLTQSQFLDGTKDVTRRLGWANLQPGTKLQAVHKSQGRRKGEPAIKLGVIEVVSVRRERLDAITDDDCRREGFPQMGKWQFIELFCQHNKGCCPSTVVTRIEFRRVDG
jgi:hypothetical protein